MSPHSPRNDDGWDGGVEKLTATSDFAVSRSLRWSRCCGHQAHDESHILTTQPIHSRVRKCVHS